MSIKIEGYVFSGPYYHTKLFNRDFGCVYVLLNKLNQVVDVGETSSVNSRIINHERKMCWIRHGCGDTGLYVYISSDENFRRLLEKLIRTKYKPPCGEY
jgi:hypothetical protein